MDLLGPAKIYFMFLGLLQEGIIDPFGKIWERNGYSVYKILVNEGYSRPQEEKRFFCLSVFSQVSLPWVELWRFQFAY